MDFEGIRARLPEDAEYDARNTVPANDYVPVLVPELNPRHVAKINSRAVLAGEDDVFDLPQIPELTQGPDDVSSLAFIDVAAFDVSVFPRSMAR